MSLFCRWCWRREGKTVFYALDDDHVRSILSMGMDHIEE